MRSIGSLTMPRLIAVVAALWLCCAGEASAGDGGSSGISLQGVLDDVCAIFGPTVSCPQLPTVTQQVIEIAGLTKRSA
jgi:hypothetical protein